MSHKNLKKLKKSSTIIPQKEELIKIQFVNCELWSLPLNKLLNELKQRALKNEKEYTVWKKNINGKPHKRNLEIDTNLESEFILIEHQKQISLKSIKELTFNEEVDNGTPEMKGFSILFQGNDSPIYYHFDIEVEYYSFVFQFVYSILRKSNLLYPCEEFCKFTIISDSIMEEDSQKLNANVGIPFHFSMAAFDLLGNPINSEETIWNSILYKNNGYFTDMKKNRKVQRCDLISHSQNISVLACTTNESGNYYLETSYIQDRTCFQKKFDMEFHPSSISFKNSFVSFENGKSNIEMRAGEGCKIELSLKDRFGNLTLLGFNPENVVLQFFEKITKSRWKWNVNEQENKRVQVNYSMENQSVYFTLESTLLLQLEIEVFYKNEKTETFLPFGLLENEIISNVDNRLFCNVIPTSIHTIEILNLDDLNHLTSLNETIIKFKPLDIYGNEIQNIENLEFEFNYRTDNEEYHNLVNVNKFKVTCKKSDEFQECKFTPEWSGIYSIKLIYNSKKVKEFSHEIHINSSDCEVTRLSSLKESETQKKLKEKKDKIEEEINNFCKFKTFRQVLNYVFEKYHPYKDQHGSLLLCTTAERPEILKVYKKLIFIIHTDQSPLLKSPTLTSEEFELLTFELNMVFNAIQNAYQSWKKLA